MGNYVVRAIEEQWETIGASRWSRRQVTTWISADSRFRGHRDLAGIVRSIQRGEHDASRLLCWALLDRVEVGDEVATRTLLQAMVPALGRELKRLLADDIYDDGPDQLLVVAANQAIHEMAGARPRWPIADLRSRAHRLVLQTLRVDREWATRVRPDEDIAAVCERAAVGEVRSPTDELAELLIEVAAAGKIRPAETVMLWLTRVEGVLPSEICGFYGETDAVFRRRRLRAEARLVAAAQHVAA